MHDNHTLGMVNVRDGELLTFLIDKESTPDRPTTVTVIALADMDLSHEMATFYQQAPKDNTALITENAIAGFVMWLVGRKLIKLVRETRIPFGNMKRPSSRLRDEYKYSINPEMFWEAKLLHRYSTSCFTVINHQSHLLTIMANVDAPFAMTATVIDGVGGILGMLRLDILSDNKHTLIDDDDIEVIRLGLQADITMNIPDLMLMVEAVSIASNPTFTVNSFNRHRDFTPVTEAVPSL